MAETTTYNLKGALKKLFQLVNFERKEITNIYFFAIVSGLIQLSLPLGIQAIVGLLFGGLVSASLVVLISFVVVGVLLNGVFQIMQMRVTERIQQRIFTRLTFLYAQRIPKLDLLGVDSYYLPELVNRFFDTASLQKGLSKLLLDFPAATIQILFGLILLSFYHPVFIVFGIALLTLVSMILYLSSSAGFTTSMQESDYKYKVAHWLEEISRNIKTFKFSQKNNLHLSKTDHLTLGYLNSRTAHFNILVFQYRIMIAFKVLITAAMLIIGTYLLVNQQINLGQFIASEIVIIAILSSVEKIIVSLETIYDVLTSIEKVDKLLQKPEDYLASNSVASAVDYNKPFAISVSNLSFTYPNKKNVLNNLNLAIKPGQKICLRGTEGSGKTTLLRVLTGAYSGYTGNISINGIPLKNIDVDKLRENVAVFFAQEELFNGTLLENLTLGNKNLSFEEVIKTCELVGLKSFIDKNPDGYKTVLDSQGQKLSSSTIQKILMARCFLYHPSLLLLENGWSGIETEYRTKIIKKLIDDKSFTLIALSDVEEFTQQCDQTITLIEGKIV
ncbi:MAG: ABC transporter ATP-binding protein [Sphingobacteriales bacterium]|nr:MAG: ABC transporter ATP-binding protein [Sphingobacteriales bacterium]TAF81692.1 MAG: ABC transporter ATP-binding protein [Sphingobacteriales bacterium]